LAYAPVVGALRPLGRLLGAGELERVLGAPAGSWPAWCRSLPLRAHRFRELRCPRRGCSSCCPHGPIAARTSRDGGATFGPLVLVGRDHGVDPPHLRTGLVPAVVVDPVTGALYAVWQDLPPGKTTNIIVL
jgi:hypothetical protein